MSYLADSFLRGEGLSSPFGVPTGPTAIVAPGYPLLVSFVFWVFGSSTLASALCLMLIGAACNVATVYLIYRLGRQIASERSAFVASLLWACSLPLIWMPTIFWETNLSALCLVGIASLFLSARGRDTISFWLTAGVLCGTAALFNPALGPSLVILAVYTLFTAAARVTRWRCLAAWAIGAVFVYSPWPLRNAQVFHACVLTRSTIGLELWMGNRPGATGFLETSLFPTYNPNELADYKARGEVGYTTYKGHIASTFIETHPAQFLQTSARRVVRFWTGTGTHAGSIFFGIHATFSLILGAAGFVLLWRTGRKHLCVSMFLPMVFFPLPYYVTHAEFRYRLVVDPILTVLMAPAISWLSKQRRAVHHCALATSISSMSPVDSPLEFIGIPPNGSSQARCI
jgi:4-amino-4-deoxy-L-arabinose transferase-like glycosyltransferase